MPEREVVALVDVKRVRWYAAERNAQQMLSSGIAEPPVRGMGTNHDHVLGFPTKIPAHEDDACGAPVTLERLDPV